MYFNGPLTPKQY